MLMFNILVTMLTLVWKNFLNHILLWINMSLSALCLLFWGKCLFSQRFFLRFEIRLVTLLPTKRRNCLSSNGSCSVIATENFTRIFIAIRHQYGFNIFYLYIMKYLALFIITEFLILFYTFYHCHVQRSFWKIGLVYSIRFKTWIFKNENLTESSSIRSTQFPCTLKYD